MGSNPTTCSASTEGNRKVDVERARDILGGSCKVRCASHTAMSQPNTHQDSNAPVAHTRSERWTENPKVVGSSPTGGTSEVG